MTILVFDADPLVYRFASSSAVAAIVDGRVMIDSDLSAAEERLAAEFERIRFAVGERWGSVETTLVAVGSGPLFRKRLFPSYKANRDPDSLPELFSPLLESCLRDGLGVRFPGLEADDVLSVLATSPKIADEVVFASTDKDLLAVPGRFAYLRRGGEIEFRETSRKEAAEEIMRRALLGDSTDNFKGCPDIGPARAKPIVESGEWGRFLDAFGKKGISPHDALTQLNMARLLWHEDFDPARGVRIATWAEGSSGMDGIRGTWLPHLSERGRFDSMEARRFLAFAGYVNTGREILEMMTDETDTEDAGAAASTGTEEEEKATSEPTPEPPPSTDNAPSPAPAQSGPFVRSAGSSERMKLLVWGGSGVGKTPLALSFPNVAMVDFENGAAPYEGVFDFGRMPATTVEELDRAIDFLASGAHNFRTVAVDSMSVFWEVLQAKWSELFLRRNVGGKGFKGDFYTMQPSDWAHVKADYRRLIRRLTMLGMNVVATARSKDRFAEGGQMMTKIGETFDAEKGTNYLFDTVIRLDRFDPASGILSGECLRDRWRRLPKGPFDVSFETFRSVVGGERVDLRATPVEMASAEQAEEINALRIKLELPEAGFTERLLSFGADEPEGLTRANAELILGKLRKAAESRRSASA